MTLLLKQRLSYNNAYSFLMQSLLGFNFFFRLLLYYFPSLLGIINLLYLFQVIYLIGVLKNLYDQIRWFEKLLLLNGDCFLYSNGIVEIFIPLVYFNKLNSLIKGWYLFMYISLLRMEKIGSLKILLQEAKTQFVINSLYLLMVLFSLIGNLRNTFQKTSSKINLKSSEPDEIFKSNITEDSKLQGIRDFLKSE